MWPITLIVGILFGATLDEKKASVEKWILAIIATIVIGVAVEFILPPLIPALASFALPSATMVITHVEIAVGAIVLGFIVNRVRKALIE
jgi:uncharacterized membrane protein (DUF106 family)